MSEPTEAAVEARAIQLFEEETGRPWIAVFTKRAEDTPVPDATDDEMLLFRKRARVELRAIEEEGHS